MIKLSVPKHFRASMNWLHTWAGIAVSCLLFMIFWMGSLAVFDHEIDQWMKPEMRVELTTSAFSFASVIDQLREDAAHNSPEIGVVAPTEREPLGYYYYQKADGGYFKGSFDPATNTPVELTASYAGTNFFYPFHYNLHISAFDIGYWIVGFCAMAMLILIVSGIFIHRKIVKDFFTFRPNKSLRRSTLDLHNISSLVALPLHILFPLTGLLIFFSIYLPWPSSVVFDGSEEQREKALFAIVSAEPSGRPAPVNIDVDRLVSEVEARWAARSPGAAPRATAIELHMANDENSYIVAREIFASRAVTRNRNRTAVSVKTGAVLADVEAGPAKSAYSWLAGAHMIQFDSWALRWLYFAGGLLGSLMIASGLMFWIQARIRKGVIEPRSVQVVRALAVGSITGIILSSGAYLVANRLIPARSDGFGMGRADFEVMFFYIVWLGTFLHAAIRGRFAWREQCLAIAPVAVLAVLLNWITTGDHPIAAAAQGLTQIWSMDLVLLAGAGIALFAAAKTKVKAGEIGTARRETAVDMVE